MSSEKQAYDHYADLGGEAYSIDRLANDAANQTRLQATVDMLPPEATSLLDVGCGGAVFLDMVRQQRQLQITGVERSYGLLAMARKRFGLSLAGGSISELPFASGAFDIVSALEVIEHLPWGVYQQALEEMARVAKTWVLVSVPYKENRKFIPCPYCGCNFNPYYHMHTFDEAKMQTLIPSYEAVELRKVHQDSRPWFYNTFYKLYFRNTLPAWTVCPACGYKKPDATPEMLRDPYATSSGLKRRLQQLYLHDLPLPKNKSYRWIIGLYRRIN